MPQTQSVAILPPHSSKKTHTYGGAPPSKTHNGGGPPSLWVSRAKVFYGGGPPSLWVCENTIYIGKYFLAGERSEQENFDDFAFEKSILLEK